MKRKFLIILTAVMTIVNAFSMTVSAEEEWTTEENTEVTTAAITESGSKNEPEETNTKAVSMEVENDDEDKRANHDLLYTIVRYTLIIAFIGDIVFIFIDRFKKK